MPTSATLIQMLVVEEHVTTWLAGKGETERQQNAAQLRFNQVLTSPSKETVSFAMTAILQQKASMLCGSETLKGVGEHHF